MAANGDILVFKLRCGDEVIGYENEHTFDGSGQRITHIGRARKIMQLPTPNGIVNIMGPFWAGASLSDDLPIADADILLVTTPDKRSLDFYIQNTSGLIMRPGH